MNDRREGKTERKSKGEKERTELSLSGNSIFLVWEITTSLLTKTIFFPQHTKGDERMKGLPIHRA